VSNRILRQLEANDSPDTHCSLCGRKFSKRVAPTEEHIFPRWLSDQAIALIDRAMSNRPELDDPPEKLEP
jgi:hypothetical protein